MSEDPRCCGTGTCIINDEGVCWCGQKWDGEKMCFPAPDHTQADEQHHRDQAELLAGNSPHWMLRAWCALVSFGSSAAVVLARRV